jgi:hypothetical protein
MSGFKIPLSVPSLCAVATDAPSTGSSPVCCPLTLMMDIPNPITEIKTQRLIFGRTNAVSLNVEGYFPGGYLDSR